MMMVQAQEHPRVIRESGITYAIYVVKACKIGGNNMNFGQAIEALKDGKKVARSGWNGVGMWIVLMQSLYLEAGVVNGRTSKHIGEGNPLDSQPYIAMWTAKKQWQPGWLASQPDILSEDWCVVE